jgi:predicted nuclease of predicted toxin-antitoxin system
MRFKVDENLPIEVAGLFQKAGHDASTVHEEGLGGAEDQRVAQQCRLEGRVLVTLDVGFADIRAYRPGDHPGIIILRLRRQDKPHILDITGQLVEAFRRENVARKLWIVEEGRLRIRG